MAKAIMIQGTMSNAGKSLLTAALCRIFQQDGYKAAPFKSQNMALNSYITKEGLEMGRAQVVQAQAAKIEPSVDMNPILLKPTTDMGSQVIVNGEVIGTYEAKEYYKQKKQLFPEVKKAYERLAEQYDIIVIEGAGSPVEINLKTDDMVNMGIARMAKAPVLLVGDIDRGGIFAQLYGTIALLEKEERKMVKGMIVNKFRGDVEILRPGLAMLEERLEPMGSIPFAGVVPYMDVDIEDEDSLSERLAPKQEVKLIDIAVIRFPKISNFTDMNALERYPNVSLRYVTNVSELKSPDMIILPGSKSTMEDLKWLRSSGLEAAILKAANKQTIIFGICGGYQMLGKYLMDPYGIEGLGELRGMGLLRTATIFQKDKTRRQAVETINDLGGPLQCLSGLTAVGYEIHMGITERLYSDQDLESDKNSALQTKETAERNEVILEQNTVYGTYLHGIFDEPEITTALLTALCKQKQISPDIILDLTSDCMSAKEYKEKQFDVLADSVRNSLDMELIYQILKEGVTFDD